MHKSVAKILKKLDSDGDKSLTLVEIKAHMNKVCAYSCSERFPYNFNLLNCQGIRNRIASDDKR